jgi:hypothetical protein
LLFVHLYKFLLYKFLRAIFIGKPKPGTLPTAGTALSRLFLLVVVCAKVILEKQEREACGCTPQQLRVA